MYICKSDVYLYIYDIFTDVYLSALYLSNHVKGPSSVSIAFLGTLHSGW